MKKKVLASVMLSATIFSIGVVGFLGKTGRSEMGSAVKPRTAFVTMENVKPLSGYRYKNFTKERKAYYKLTRSVKPISKSTKIYYELMNAENATNKKTCSTRRCKRIIKGRK